jgi:processing peptidase subunit alpha
MAYNIDCVRTAVPEALEILTDSVLNPKFLPWEVADALAKMQEDLERFKDNPQSILLEARANIGRAPHA